MSAVPSSEPMVRIVPENHNSGSDVQGKAFRWTTAHDIIGVQVSSPVCWGHNNGINYFAYVVANRTIEICCYNMEEGMIVVDRLSGINGEVDFLEFCPRTDKFVIVAGGENGLHAWEVKIEEASVPIKFNSGGIYKSKKEADSAGRNVKVPRVHCGAWAYDGRILFTGEKDSDFRIWSFHGDSINLIQVESSHKSAVTSIAVESKEHILCTAGRDGMIKVWSCESLSKFSENQDKTKKLMLLKDLSAHRGGITNLVFTKDGSLLSAGRDNTMKLWNLIKFELVRDLGHPMHNHQADINDICLINDDTGLITIAGDGLCKTWAINGEFKQAVDANDLMTAMQQQSRGGREGNLDEMIYKFIEADQEEEATELAAVTDEMTNSFFAHPEGIAHATYLADGQLLLTSSVDACIRIWKMKPVFNRDEKQVTNVMNHLPAFEQFAHMKVIGDLVIHNNMLASCSTDNNLNIYKLQNDTWIHHTTFSRHESLTSCVFSDDGGSIFAGGIDYEIWRYELQDKAEECVNQDTGRFCGHTGQVTSMVVSGKYLLSASRDFHICKYDLSKAGNQPGARIKPTARLNIKNGMITDMAYGKVNGKDLLGVSLVNHTVEVYDVGKLSSLTVDLTPLYTLHGGHIARVNAVTFLNNLLISGGNDARICVWDLSAKGKLLQSNGGEKEETFEHEFSFAEVDKKSDDYLNDPFHRAPISALSTFDNLLVSGSNDDTARVYEIGKDAPGSITSLAVYSAPTEDTGGVCTVCSNSNFVALGTKYGIIRIYNAFKDVEKAKEIERKRGERLKSISMLPGSIKMK